MDSIYLDSSIAKLSSIQNSWLSLHELKEFSRVYAFIIDSQCRFTASHSSGVATVAQALGLAHGLNERNCLKLRIAGHLHDIGKLSVPPEILNKNAALTEDEMLIMKGHSFYTQKIFTNMKGMEDIARWAGNHHEFLDGSGYPFGLKAVDLDIESRILTIADIFTALTEDRPYRLGMDIKSALGMLENFAQRGQIDLTILNTLITNAAEINEQRWRSQEMEKVKLERFSLMASSHIEKSKGFNMNALPRV